MHAGAVLPDLLRVLSDRTRTLGADVGVVVSSAPGGAALFSAAQWLRQSLGMSAWHAWAEEGYWEQTGSVSGDSSGGGGGGASSTPESKAVEDAKRRQMEERRKQLFDKVPFCVILNLPLRFPSFPSLRFPCLSFD